jgi:hypothetical protein
MVGDHKRLQKNKLRLALLLVALPVTPNAGLKWMQILSPRSLPACLRPTAIG